VNKPKAERRLHRLAHWFISVLPGRCYHGVQYGVEHLRLLAYHRVKMNQRLQITGEMVQPQLTLLLEAVVLALACSVPDWLLIRAMSVMPSLSRFDSFVLSHVPLFGAKSAPSFFALVAGAVAAMLGLVLALYGIGLQQNLGTYSHEVVDYASKDPVTRSYFRLIVLTEIYCLMAWVRYRTLGPGTGVALVVSLLLALISFVGLLPYREFLVSSLHPVNLLRQLVRDVSEAVNCVTTQDSLMYGSWSIAQGSRARTSMAFDVADQLFRDLCASPRQKDNAKLVAGFATTCWLTYAARKPLLDKDRGAWFPMVDKQLSPTDTVQMTLNLAFQREGRGAIPYPVPDQNWFEDRCLHILRDAALNVAFSQNEGWQAAVFWSLKELVVGQYEENLHQFNVQTRPGLLQQWEYQQVSRAIDLVSTSLVAYGSGPVRNWRDMTNMIGVWGACVADGQDYSAVIQELSQILDSSNHLKYSRTHYSGLSIPGPLHDLLLRVYDQLATEQSAEGAVLTPLGWVVDSSTGEIETLERSEQSRLMDELVELQNKVTLIDAREANHLALTWHMKARLSWFIKLSNHARLDVVEQHQAWWGALRANFASDGDCLEESDLRTTTEVLLFAAAYERRSGLARALVGIWVLEMNVLSSYYQQKAGSADASEARRATADFLSANRARLVVGGYIYALAELDSNWELLQAYLEDLLGNVDSQQSLATSLEGSSVHGVYGRVRFVLGLDMAELTRYRPLFEQVFQEIARLPRSSPDAMPYSRQSLLSHSSAFIQSLGLRLDHLEIDDFAEGFLNWLRKKCDADSASKTDSGGGRQ